MSKDEYTDLSEITTFKRHKEPVRAVHVKNWNKPTFTEHSLQFKRTGSEQFRRAFIDDHPVQTPDGLPVFEHQVGTIEDLIAMLDRGDTILDETFEEA